MLLQTHSTKLFSAINGYQLVKGNKLLQRPYPLCGQGTEKIRLLRQHSRLWCVWILEGHNWFPWIRGNGTDKVKNIPYDQYIFKHTNFQTLLEAGKHADDVVFFSLYLNRKIDNHDLPDVWAKQCYRRAWIWTVTSKTTADQDCSVSPEMCFNRNVRLIWWDDIADVYSGTGALSKPKVNCVCLDFVKPVWVWIYATLSLILRNTHPQSKYLLNH